MSKSVTITANDDGSFQVEAEPVGVEPAEAAEGAETGAADMAEDKAEGEPSKNVANLNEALAAAAQMLGGAGKPMMDGEAAFSQGFKQVRGTPDEQQAARMMR